MNALLNLIDTSSLRQEELHDLRNLNINIESIYNYINKYHKDFPDPQKDVAGIIIDQMFNQLYLDEQVKLLKTIIQNHSNAKRALKLLGLRYFWSLDNRFIDSGIKSLLKYIELDKQSNLSATYEVLGGLYQLKGDQQRANECFKLSARFDIDYVVKSYGSLNNYSELQRQNKKGVRFKDFNSGKYTFAELLF